MRCRNSRPYRSATASKSPARVPSYSMSISRSPRVATAMGEATTSLTMGDASEERVDRRGAGGQGRDLRDLAVHDVHRLESVPRHEEHAPLLGVDPPVREGAAEGREGHPARGLRADALPPRAG